MAWYELCSTVRAPTLPWAAQRTIEKNNRVAQIRSAIDAGRPVPLGLKDGGGGGDHQVLAIGNELGPYDSGSGSYPELKKYSAKTPPAANPIKKGLLLTFRTGGDDLRGDNDNINIRLKFKDGSTTSFNNVNNGQWWQDHSLESVALPVSNPADVTEVRVTTTARRRQVGHSIALPAARLRQGQQLLGGTN